MMHIPFQNQRGAPFCPPMVLLAAYASNSLVHFAASRKTLRACGARGWPKLC
jgi:hypothetical protein